MVTIIQIDTQLFHFFNSTISNPVFDWLMPIFSNEHLWAIPLVIVWLGMLIFGKKHIRIAAIIILLAVSSSDLVCARAIKPSVKRLRPSHELKDARLLIGKGGKYGFPSNHAANITAAMTLLILFYRKYKYLFIAIAALVSFSRVYVGVHYPLDVIAGAAIGVLLAYLWFFLWILISNREYKKGKYYLSIQK